MLNRDLTCARKYDYYLFDLTKQRAKACCKSPFPSDSASFKEDLQTILFEREQLQKGIKIKSCETCWILEEQGQRSFRSRESSDSRELSGEEHRPQRAEIIFGNKCNLKCIYCGPDSSSMWNNKKTQSAMLSNDTLSFLEDAWEDLGLIILIGGEPALIPEVFTFSEELKKIEARKPSAKKKVLKVISNFAVPHGIFKTFIDKLCSLHHFADIEVGVSAEALGEQFEYIRDGASFEVFSKNLDYALQFSEINLALQSTVSILSIAKFHEFLDFYIQKVTTAGRPMDFIYNEVVQPVSLAPRYYPFPLDQEREQVLRLLQAIPIEAVRGRKRFRLFKEAIVQLYDGVGKADVSFSLVTEFLDRSESKRLMSGDWRKTFPELATFESRQVG